MSDELLCSECACTTNPADAAFCPDCGHAAARHVAGDGPSDNEETRLRIEAWLTANHGAVEVARLANEHGLRWDGEDRVWSASNVAWFETKSEGAVTTAEGDPATAAPPAHPVGGYRNGATRPVARDHNRRNWMLVVGGLVVLSVMFLAASMAGGASMSPDEIADCIAEAGDFDESSFETFTRSDLLDGDIEGADDQAEADAYSLTEGMTTVVGVYFYPVSDADDAPDVADYFREYQDEDDVSVYGKDVVVVGPYLQDQTDAQLAAADAGFECIEGGDE